MITVGEKKNFFLNSFILYNRYFLIYYMVPYIIQGVQGAPPPSALERDRFYGNTSTVSSNDMMAVRPMYDPYFDNLKSPLIKDESDGKTLRLR